MVAMDSKALRNSPSSTRGGVAVCTAVEWKPFRSDPKQKLLAGFGKETGLALIDDDTPRGNNPLD